MSAATAAAATTTTGASPWGVQLKKTPRGRNPVPNTRQSLRRLKEDAQAEDRVKQHRSSLRKVNVPPRSSGKASAGASQGNRYTRPGSRGWKLRPTGAPLFGVVLRRLATIQEEEEFMDLDLMQQQKGSEPSKKAERLPSNRDTIGGGGLDESNHNASNHSRQNTTSASGSNAPNFGVRLKPHRRTKKTLQLSSADTPTIDLPPLKTYQIDLNPTQKSDSGKDKSFLEVKLRPVQPKQRQPEDRPSVEFQLRHVVAPADGGPNRTASEALFQVPLLKPVSPPNERKNWKSTSLEGHQDLLQIGISNLKPPAVNEAEGITLQSLQIQAKQVDPETQQTHTMEHVIDVELRHKEGDTEAKENTTVPQWTMKVQLKSAKDLDEDASERSWGKAGLDFVEPDPKECIQLKPVTRPTKCEGDTDSDDEDFDDDEDDFADEFGEEDFDDSNLLDIDYSEHTCSETLEERYEDDDDDDDEDSFGGDDDDDEEEEEPPKAAVPTKRMSVPVRNLTPPPIKNQNTRSSMPNIAVLEKSDDDDSGSSDSDSDDDDEKEEEKQQLNQHKRRDLLMWYNRMRMPTKEQMIQRVKRLPQPCDITPEDVEHLPWIAGGKFLNIKVMNQMFLDDWQGEEKKDGTAGTTAGSK